jgi:DNA-binding transcriptional MerR regulator/methylmalonyl-CoA mutase cobalamin-binding subunit
METREVKPYTIQQMASLTGVKPVTLRAWERRYGLLHPQRSEGRYRMYGQQDVDTIMRVSALLDKGMSIKQAAEVVQQQRPHEVSPKAGSHWTVYIEGMLEAVTRLDEVALEKAYHKALSDFPIAIVLRQVIIPLLQELGQRWEDGRGSVAEEHFFSVYLRNQLGAQFHHQRAMVGDRRLLAACLPGEYHDSGLLIFALAAQALSYQVTMLGANMPLEELITAAKQTQADGIVLSGSIVNSFKDNKTKLQRLIQQASIPVMIGGVVSQSCLREISAIGAIALGTDIDNALSIVDKHIG